MNKPSETDPSKTKENFQYFKLSFIGAFSKFTKNELQKLTRQFCKDDTILKFLKIPHVYQNHYKNFHFFSLQCIRVSGNSINFDDK